METFSCRPTRSKFQINRDLGHAAFPALSAGYVFFIFAAVDIVSYAYYRLRIFPRLKLFSRLPAFADGCTFLLRILLGVLLLNTARDLFCKAWPYFFDAHLDSAVLMVLKISFIFLYVILSSSYYM